MTVSTDDAARRLRFLYLGPRDFRWPAATVPAYLLFFGLTITGITATWATRPNLGVWLLLEAPLVIAAALLITRRVFEHINTDRNLRYQIATVKAELSAPRPPAPAETRVTAIRPHLFTDHKDAR